MIQSRELELQLDEEGDMELAGDDEDVFEDVEDGDGIPGPAELAFLAELQQAQRPRATNDELGQLRAVAEDLDSLPPELVESIFSKISEDGFHVVYRLTRLLKRGHGARYDFILAYVDALYCRDPEDWAKVKERWPNAEELWNWGSRMLRKRVRMWFRPITEMHSMVAAVFAKFKDIRDQKTGMKLFHSKKIEEVAERILLLITKGLIGDRPDLLA
jgi:hypothetical protein